MQKFKVVNRVAMIPNGTKMVLSYEQYRRRRHCLTVAEAIPERKDTGQASLDKWAEANFPRLFTVDGPAGAHFKLGEFVEMEAQALRRVDLDGLEPVGEKANAAAAPISAEQRQAKVLAALAQINPKDRDHVSKEGVPKVGTLRKLSGLYDLTASERDKVMAGLVVDDETEDVAPQPEEEGNPSIVGEEE